MTLMALPSSASYFCHIILKSSFHPIIFNNIDGSLSHSIVLQLDGAAGPCGKQLCTYFHSDSSDVCYALAAISRQFCH